MKKLLCIICALLMIMSLACCKDNTEPVQVDTPDSAALNSNDKSKECTEQVIRELMERNLDCYYLFYISPLLDDGSTNSDGYSPVADSFFESYDAMHDFLASTYTKNRTKALLKHPSVDTPLYKESNGKISVKPDVITPAKYEVMWDENYTIEITDSTDIYADFTATTTDFDGKEYKTNGRAVYEDGKWLLDKVVY